VAQQRQGRRKEIQAVASIAEALTGFKYGFQKSEARPGEY
jgi:hypothetical protein